jgi:hypothetical protein
MFVPYTFAYIFFIKYLLFVFIPTAYIMYNTILDIEMIASCFHNVSMCDMYLFISVRHYSFVPVYIRLKASPWLARLPYSPGNHYPDAVCTLMVE